MTNNLNIRIKTVNLQCVFHGIRLLRLIKDWLS